MSLFHFRQFDIDDHGCGMKLCSDSVLLAAWFFPHFREARRVADIGAGSGILSLLAACIIPHARITAIEIDRKASLACEANFAASPWADRLESVNCDFNGFVAGNPAPFDVVISNPPYFAVGERSADKSRATARHQSSLAYTDILAHSMLSSDGHLGLVSPADIEQEIIYNAELNRLKVRRLCRVRTSPSKSPIRLLWDISPTDGPLSDTTLSLRDSDGSYSGAYRELVEPFYMKL
ncbi:MAG: methyltransferase [Muribaculaceae bacterium]|nr:methyltransferase [Muribaculaceae bacterium]